MPDRVETINRLAFSHHLTGSIDLNTTRAGGFGVEFHATNINLRINPRIPTRMRYQDINGDPYDISGTIIFENNQVRFERDIDV